MHTPSPAPSPHRSYYAYFIPAACATTGLADGHRLLAAADEWCSRVAEMPGHTVAMTKPLLRAAADADWNDAITLEEFAEPTCFTTAAFADNVRAMLNGR